MGREIIRRLAKKLDKVERAVGAPQSRQYSSLLLPWRLPCCKSFQLHHFSDASEFGYGTVSYLRRETWDGMVNCSFIMAKSRTAPLPYVSIPRLELQAATIAARVQSMIVREIDLNISSTFFWTDSQLTLQYIRNESCRFKTYVANRVCEIRQVSEPSQWRH